jgi:hypothetical protein
MNRHKRVQDPALGHAAVLQDLASLPEVVECLGGRLVVGEIVTALAGTTSGGRMPADDSSHY